MSYQKTNFCFSHYNLQQASNIIKRYPNSRKQSAVLPLLDLAQRQNGGWLSKQAIEYIAELLEMPCIRVYEVATFYTMFNLAPVGKYHIQVCCTTPCWLRGSDQIMQTCEQVTELKAGQTDNNAVFTLSEVECLGACINAPVIQINDDYYENLTPNTVKKLIQQLKDVRN